MTNQNNFKIGDFVTLNLTLVAPNRIYGRIESGSRGTVCAIASTGRIGVSFDKYIYGHNCNGKCLNGTGLWLLPEDLSITEKTTEDYFNDLVEMLE